MPAQDIYATCPNDGRVLAYYSGTFDAVYVSLSPFIQPVSISPALFCPKSYPDRKTIMQSCEPVSWEEVATKTQLPSRAALDIGLRTQIGGLNRKHANDEYASRLNEYLDASGLAPPVEGEHSDLLHNIVLGLFQRAGHQWVWVGDEFCSERKLHWIEDLKNESIPTVKGRSNVFSPDKSLLWSVHWDSHFSFLCSSRENLDRLEVASLLEGFFCNAETEVYWSVYEA